jgi:RNA polymerase sigma-70 factor (ECF subfamily)
MAALAETRPRDRGRDFHKGAGTAHGASDKLASRMSQTGRRTQPGAADEAPLLARLRAGDEAAFALLVRQNAGRLLAVARRMLRSEEDARDALQDAFLQAFRGIGRFEGGAQLSTWLHRILINACLMRLRSRGRKPEESIEDLLPRFYEDGHRIDPGPAWRAESADPVESRELRALVRASIDRLPDIYRNVLLLRDIEGLSTEEAAQMLDVKVDTVKVRLHRARQALRALLDPHLARETA